MHMGGFWGVRSSFFIMVFRGGGIEVRIFAGVWTRNGNGNGGRFWGIVQKTSRI